MNIRNLAGLVKTERVLILTTASKGILTGRIERADIQAQTVTIKTINGDILVVEASDVLKIGFQEGL